MTHPRVCLAALVVALPLAACGSEEERLSSSPTRTLVGKVAGSHAYVALVSDGSRVAGYVCDGRKLSRWLKPVAIDDGAATLRGRDGRVLGTVRIASRRAAGELDVGERRARFTALPARGEAGLYQQRTGSPGARGYRETGWIVLADGTHRGSTQFTSTDTDLVVGPAPKRTAKAAPVTSFTSTDVDL